MVEGVITASVFESVAFTEATSNPLVFAREKYTPVPSLVSALLGGV